MVTRDTTSATEALQLMVERHFRHLVSPIVPLLHLHSFAHPLPFSPYATKTEMSSVSSILPRFSTKPSTRLNEARPPLRNYITPSPASSLNSVGLHRIPRLAPCSHMSKRCAKRPHCPI